VQLLASVGGKLDVMTHSGKGTTFWAHFPLNKKRAASGAGEAESDNVELEPAAGELVDVVHAAATVRKFEGG
jgi:hypothetical protein